MQQSERLQDWTLTRRILFRFFSVYFLVYALTIMITEGGNDSFFMKIWNKPVTWIGRLLISPQYQIEVWPNGSGDTTFNYLQIVCFFILTLLINIVWWAIERKRTHYEKQEYFIRSILRFTLATTMLTYGMAKLTGNQFVPPMNYQLDQRLGDMSPMGLAWTYMGYSKAYMTFTGIAEILGGVLLLFRKTTLLGALVSMAVMVNVVAMNLCFDIPVKLFSSHLLMVCCFLAAPDLSRMINLLVTNSPAPPANYWYPSIRKKGARIAFTVFRYLLIVLILGGNITSLISYSRKSKDTVPLAGSYEILDQKFAGERPATLSLFNNWQKIYVEDRGMLIARDHDNQIAGYYLKIDTVKKTFTAWAQENDSLELHYRQGPGQQLTLTALINKDTLTVALKGKSRDSTILIGRGFRWVNEYPYNR